GSKAALLADLPRISWPDSPDNSDSTVEPPAGRRRIVMAFHSTVDRAEGPGRIERLDIGGPDARTFSLPTETLIRSTGHRGAPVADLPFDETSATVPNASVSVVTPGSGAACHGAHYLRGIQ